MANTNDIVIKEVVTKCDIRKFVKFQWRLFKDVPTYLPPLMLDEMTLLTKKNPSLEYCSLKMWMAYRDGKPVGRQKLFRRLYRIGRMIPVGIKRAIFPMMFMSASRFIS